MRSGGDHDMLGLIALAGRRDHVARPVSGQALDLLASAHRQPEVIGVVREVVGHLVLGRKVARCRRIRHTRQPVPGGWCEQAE